MEEKVIGFVINKTTYKDSDSIINILTKENKKVSFKARGILKINSKNALSCNYFVISEYILNYKNVDGPKNLKSASVLKMYHQPYSNLITSSVFTMILNIIYQVENQIDIYDDAIYCFDKLEDSQNNPIDVANYFLKIICEKMGYRPFIDGCVNCHKKNHLLTFDFKIGGYICSDCLPEYNIKIYPVDYLKSIHYFLKKDELVFLNSKYAKELFFQYLNFLNDEMGLYFNFLDFFKNIL